MTRRTPTSKFGLFLLALLLAMSAALAQPTFQTNDQADELKILYPNVEVLKQGDDNVLSFHVFNSTNRVLSGSNASCFVHLFDPSNGAVLEDSLSVNGVGYEFVSNTTDLGRYFYNVWCNTSSEGGFVGGYYDVTVTGKIERSNGTFLPGVLALIPLFFAFLVALWALSLSDSHNLLKHVLFLFGFVLTWTSLHFATLGVIKFFDWPEMQQTVGDTLFWLVIVFVVVFFYFVVYWLAWMVNHAAGKKKERLEYD